MNKTICKQNVIITRKERTHAVLWEMTNIFALLGWCGFPFLVPEDGGFEGGPMVIAI